MTLSLEPELGVPLSTGTRKLDLKKRAQAAANTALDLAEYGMDLLPNKEDKDVASKLASSYASDPDKTSKTASAARMSTLTPASIVLTNSILTEFGRSVVESSVQIRHLVTNKLLLETENPDPRTRIRALELLGKISDVGLFAEKSEITITHQSTDDLKSKLRRKLEKLVPVEEEAEDAVLLEGEVIDLGEELGLEDEFYDDE
jgi:hypothetical protein|tara:strand:- start:2007 stop:2615 length:609 start_codon:yes stop_codon:yes gene_type:complete